MNRKEKVKSKSKSKNANPIIIIVLIVLALYALTLFFVLGWGLLTSLKSTYEFVNRAEELGGPNVLGLPDIDISRRYFVFLDSIGKGLGDYHIFKNYELIYSSFTYEVKPQSYYSSIFGLVGEDRAPYYSTFFGYIFNSILYAFVGAGLFAFFSMTAGYLCCKFKYRYSSFLYTLLLVMMTVPLIGTAPSTVKLLKDLGIYDTYFSMFIMNATFGGLYFFVFYAYFKGLSDTYLEAAKLDGASEMGIFIHIIVPLSLKVMGTVFLIQFIALWNNYDAPLLYYPSEPTLAYAIYRMSENTDGTNRSADTQGIPQRVAGCMILAIPITILFLCFSKVLLGNLTLGGLKE